MARARVLRWGAPPLLGICFPARYRVVAGRRTLGGERLRLERLELRAGDRVAVEQLLGSLDLAGGAARPDPRRHAPVGLRLALCHLTAVGDEVDEDAQERQD